jgi:hypothetical protein
MREEPLVQRNEENDLESLFHDNKFKSGVFKLPHHSTPNQRENKSEFFDE